MTEPQPQLQIVDIRKNSKFKVQSGPGYFWEHMDIQFGPKGHPALKQAYVRQAIITGINRNQIKQALYVTPGLVGNAKDLPVLQSHIFKPFEENYQPNWAKWSFSQKKVISMLKAKGCTGGPSTPSANSNPAASSSSFPGVRIVVTKEIAGPPPSVRIRISSGSSTARTSSRSTSSSM